MLNPRHSTYGDEKMLDILNHVLYLFADTFFKIVFLAELVKQYFVPKLPYFLETLSNQSLCELMLLLLDF